MISSQTSGDISFLSNTCLLTLTEKMGMKTLPKCIAVGNRLKIFFLIFMSLGVFHCPKCILAKCRYCHLFCYSHVYTWREKIHVQVGVRSSVFLIFVSAADSVLAGK